MSDKELVSYAVAGLSIGVGLSVFVQAQNTLGVAAGLLIMCISLVVLR